VPNLLGSQTIVWLWQIGNFAEDPKQGPYRYRGLRSSGERARFSCSDCAISES
jgi:hypothetical protein